MKMFKFPTLPPIYNLTSNDQTMSKHMTDKQMILSDSDASFQLNCEENYANYSIWAAMHGTAFVP